MKTNDKAKIVISRITGGEQVHIVRQELAPDRNDWNKISQKAYLIHLQVAREQRKKDAKLRNIGSTLNEEIDGLIELNDKLSAYAICLPTVATKSAFKVALDLLPEMPEAKNMRSLLFLIEEMTLKPIIRAQQNIGRIRHFEAFKEFAHLVEAATLCYYRGNYASSYLTLVPVIEGVILRWSGYQGIGVKPQFKEIRKFFSRAYFRQPCPGNPLFHDVFCKACDKIINDHLYRPSMRGGASYEGFNRHLASHLLRDTTFASRENCIRLFLLLDTMAQIYLYETHCSDPRFNLIDEDTHREVTLYQSLLWQTASGCTPESVLLRGSST